MKHYQITIKGNDGFTLTNIYMANKIEDAIQLAIKVALPLTIEDLAEITAAKISQ